MATDTTRSDVISVVAHSTAGRVLILNQRDRTGRLIPSCPGGKIEQGESYRSAFLRESLEELGVSIDGDFRTPNYQVELRRLNEVIHTSVFEQHWDESYRRLIPRRLDTVESAAWLSPEHALKALVESPARHISEPLLSHISGQVRSASWCYDIGSSHLAMAFSTEDPRSACVSGHFQIRGHHTELLGAPAIYLLRPVELANAARRLAALIGPYDPESIITPAVGGVALASATAIELGLPLAVVERTANGTYGRSRGAPVTRRTALVDSTFHTGETVAAVSAFTQALGGALVAAAVAVRSVVISGLVPVPASIPVHALENIVVHSWKPAACPLCHQGLPVDQHPSRYEGRANDDHRP